MTVPFTACRVDAFPYINDLIDMENESHRVVTINKGLSVGVSTSLNMNDCLLKQQLNGNAYSKKTIINEASKYGAQRK